MECVVSPRKTEEGVCVRVGRQVTCTRHKEQEHWWDGSTLCEQRIAEGKLGREWENAQLHMICSNSEEDRLQKANTGGTSFIISIWQDIMEA